MWNTWKQFKIRTNVVFSPYDTVIIQIVYDQSSWLWDEGLTLNDGVRLGYRPVESRNFVQYAVKTRRRCEINHNYHETLIESRM